jgi:hypothetical protein
MAAQQWAEAQAYFISEKTKKLRSGNYSEFPESWLLIQDEWRVPLYNFKEKEEASKICLELIQPSLKLPSFSRIYISSSSLLIRLFPSPIEILEIRDVWN